MKKFILAAFLLTSVFAQAQLSANVNGKDVKNGATISKNDLASLQVSFKNPKDVTIISGLSVLCVDLIDADDKNIQSFFLSKDGYVAIEDFLKTSANKKMNVFGKGGFPNRGNTLEWILSSSQGIEKRKNIKAKVSLYVVQETGYQEYGPRVELLTPIELNVTVWDTKNLYLPFVDLTLDKTNIKGDIETNQDGSTDDARTTVGYSMGEYAKWYSIFVWDTEKYPGLNLDETANDFIHGATLWANYNNLYSKENPFKDYDVEKFKLNWDVVMNLCDYKDRISKVSYQVDKSAKKANLMDLYEKVTVNGLNGYKFKSSTDRRSDINASDWKHKGNFVIYILEHPKNPKLILVVASSLKNVDNTVEETDALLLNVINGIKKG